MGIAIRMAKVMEMMPRTSVTGRRRASSSETARFVQSDSPRLPRAMLPSHEKYWT